MLKISNFGFWGVALAGAMLMSQQSTAQHSAHQASEDSFALVKQAFAQTDPRYLLAFSRQCVLGAPLAATRKGVAAPPSALFDDLFYVGRTDVGAWILKTSDGLILFDTLYTEDDAENILIAGMRKLGLDPNEIKYVLLSHFHPDHSGGRGYFQRKGIPILAGAEDWEELGGAPNPESIVQDGQILQLGETSVKLLLTPGHTPGTIASIFPVTQNGKQHVAMLDGGLTPRGKDISKIKASLGTLSHVLEEVRLNGVDVQISPHSVYLDSVTWGYIMFPNRRKHDVNDLITSTPKVEQFLNMVSTCMQARIKMIEEAEAVGQK